MVFEVDPTLKLESYEPLDGVKFMHNKNLSSYSASLSGSPQKSEILHIRAQSYGMIIVEHMNNAVTQRFEPIEEEGREDL